MDQWYNIFNLLYSRFLLRDFFGKIIPGFIVIFFGASVLFLPNNLVSYISHFSFWGWLLFIGVAWITGFIVQSFGYLIHLINYEYPDKDTNCYTLKIWKSEQMKRKLDFAQVSSKDEKQQYERITVIKEATGNGTVALLICLLFLLVTLIFKNCQQFHFNKCQEHLYSNWIFHPDWHMGFIFTIIVISGISFYCMYRLQKIKQYEYRDHVLEHRGKDHQRQLTSNYKL